MKILGKTTTPFAIKAGGHTFNQHFSSTLGIQIALTRLNEVTYDKKSNTVTLGMGNTCASYSHHAVLKLLCIDRFVNRDRRLFDSGKD